MSDGIGQSGYAVTRVSDALPPVNGSLTAEATFLGSCGIPDTSRRGGVPNRGDGLPGRGSGPTSAAMTATLFTIGYEGADPDRLAAALRDAGVATLADVRAVALSRKRGFSKTALAAHLAGNGLAYLHLRALGTPAAGRAAARAGDSATMRRIFCDEVLDTPAGEAALTDLAARAAGTEGPICLFCFERDPAGCHRRVLAERLAARGLAVVDLFA